MQTLACMPYIITWELSSSLHSFTLFDDYDHSLAGDDEDDVDDNSQALYQSDGLMILAIHIEPKSEKKKHHVDDQSCQ